MTGADTAAGGMRPRPLGERNKAVLAAREAAPRLPARWGSSLRGVAGCIPRAAPCCDDVFDDIRRLAVGATFAERLLRVLEALAARGLVLPSVAGLARLLGAATDREVREGLHALVRRGAIRQRVGPSGSYGPHRGVVLAASGAVLRTSGTPAEWLA